MARTVKEGLRPRGESAKIGLLTYGDAAHQLGVPEGTLRRKLIDFNKQAAEADQVKPDLVEDHGHYKKHFYNQASMPRIQAALLAITKRGPGNPWTGKRREKP